MLPMGSWPEGVWVEATAEAGQVNYRATSALRALTAASSPIKVPPLTLQRSGFRSVPLVKWSCCYLLLWAQAKEESSQGYFRVIQSQGKNMS